MIEILVGVGIATALYLVGLPTLLFRAANSSRRQHEVFAAWAAARDFRAGDGSRPLPGPEAIPYGYSTRYEGSAEGVPVGARLSAATGNSTTFTVQLWAGGLPPDLRLARHRSAADQLLTRALEAAPGSIPEAAPAVPLDSGDPELDDVARIDGPTSPALLARLDAPTRALLLQLLRTRGATVTRGHVSLLLDVDSYAAEADERFALLVAVARAFGAADAPGDAPRPSTAARLAALARTDPIPSVRARAATALATLVPRDVEARVLARELAGRAPSPDDPGPSAGASPEPAVVLPCAAALGDLPLLLAAGDAPGAPAALAATLLLDDAAGPGRLGAAEDWADWLARRLADEAADAWRRGEPSPAAHHQPLLALAARHGDSRLLPVLGPLADDPMLDGELVRDTLAAIRARAAPALAGSVALAEDPGGTLALASEATPGVDDPPPSAPRRPAREPDRR